MVIEAAPARAKSITTTKSIVKQVKGITQYMQRNCGHANRRIPTGLTARLLRITQRSRTYIPGGCATRPNGLVGSARRRLAGQEPAGYLFFQFRKRR